MQAPRFEKQKLLAFKQTQHVVGLNQPWNRPIQLQQLLPGFHKVHHCVQEAVSQVRI
jgi:hypothetical protein